MQYYAVGILSAECYSSVHVGPTGSETLKNLVLGGIAAFTVVDGGTVSPADLGNNFLVEASALGQRRAPAVTSALKACVEKSPPLHSPSRRAVTLSGAARGMHTKSHHPC